MDVRKFFLGQPEFKSPQEIIELVAESPQFDSQQESAQQAEGLLIFQTSRQQTWIVVTRLRLYCVLDDIGKGFTRVQWAIPREQCVANEQVTLPVEAHERGEPSDRSGLVDIGGHRNWLFSKKLFTTESITDKLRAVIAQCMIS